MRSYTPSRSQHPSFILLGTSLTHLTSPHLTVSISLSSLDLNHFFFLSLYPSLSLLSLSQHHMVSSLYSFLSPSDLFLLFTRSLSSSSFISTPYWFSPHPPSFLPPILNLLLPCRKCQRGRKITITGVAPLENMVNEKATHHHTIFPQNTPEYSVAQ